MLKEFGQDLRKLRELKGVSIAEISAESRINSKFLVNLENGIFDFQPETYIRSFIKAYARALNENENQLLNDYDKAKAGFYSRRKFLSDEGKEILQPEEKITISVTEQPKKPDIEEEQPVYSETIKEEKPDYFKAKQAEPEKEFSNRSITQKILLVVLAIAIGAGIYFLIDYLNNSSNKKSEVKPKTFNEISSEYENKLSGKKDSLESKDTTQNQAVDSLKLMVKALKDITVKIYIDENKLVEEEINAKDSLIVNAKEQFRFSSTGNQSVEIYLNGKYLRKPASLSGTSIKNLIIKKDGIESK